MIFTQVRAIAVGRERDLIIRVSFERVLQTHALPVPGEVDRLPVRVEAAVTDDSVVLGHALAAAAARRAVAAT